MSDFPEISMQYIAGFFDGEGCITIHHGAKGRATDWRLGVSISQKCNKAMVLFWLKEKYGGCVYSQKRSKGNPNWSDVYTWQVSLRKAEKFLKDIHPYLIIKREQAELGLKMMSMRRPRARPWKDQEGHWDGEKYAAEMRALNSTRATIQ